VSIAPPTAADRLEAGIRHLRMMTGAVGADLAAREMRKHVAWYIKGLPNSARVREQVNRARGVEEMAALLRGYLEELSGRESAVRGEDPQPGAGLRREDAVAAG
jgi:tRNA-dihydrouridine synthase B